jgi:hypothetical protein
MPCPKWILRLENFAVQFLAPKYLSFQGGDFASPHTKGDPVCV